MADITCPRCNGTGTDPQTQQSCVPCGGDGILDLVDPGFLEQQIAGMIESGGYLVWAAMYAGLLNEMEKLNDLTDKVNDIKEVVDEIKEVVDAL